MKPQISILLLCALLLNSLASPGVGQVSAFMQEEMTPTPTATETPTEIPLPSPTPEETPTPTATDTIEPTPSASETPAPSETPTPTIIETETSAPTPSETPFITPTYTGTPTIAPTSSETPTLVPTISETPTSTPFISETPTETPIITETPTATATFTPTPSGPIRLVLKSDPPYLTGTTVIVQGTIEGMQLTDVTDSLELLFHFSAGLSPAGEAVGVLNRESMTYSLPVKESSIKTDWKIEPEAESPFYIEAELRQGKTSLAKASLMLQERYEMKTQGGELSGLHGRVVITFPPEALSEDAFVFIHRPRRETTPPYTLSGHPFEITASGSSSRLAIKNFDKWIKIQVAYDEANLPGPEGDLTLFWYDGKSQSWHPLPSYVDMKNHVLVAHTDHLTVLDVGVQDWQAARLPSVAAFQVSTFTGAATYSMDFNLPPGPAGLQPSLTLSYNSLVIDQASANTQASWVGMGWSLDTAYVERNMHGTDFDLTDDSYSINLNGVSGMLLLGDDGYYHTTDESFYRIQYDETNNKWKAWDKTGTLYAFGHASYYGAKNDCYGPVNTPWRWSLTRVTNIFGQELVYHYVTEDKEFHYFDCHEPPVEKNYTAQLAVYPDYIDYPNSRYRVIFTRNTNREDYDTDWEDPFSAVLYQRSSLDKISIKEDSNGDGSFETLVRQYVFTYETDPVKVVLPSITWSATGKNLTLAQVQEFGKGGTDPLPATSFSYGDKMHLTWAENGYGGAVEFSYETDPWHDEEASESRTNKQLFGDSQEPDYIEPCNRNGNPGDPQGWVARDPDFSEYVYCHDGELKVFVEARNARIGEKGFFKPGSYYNIYAEMKAGRDVKHLGQNAPWGTYAKIGIYDGYSDHYTLRGDLSEGSTTNFDHTLLLRPDAKKAMTLLDTNGAYVSKFILKVLPTFYRVLEKKLYDGNGNVYTFTYTYTGPATNNPTISTAAGTSNPYIEPYSEFRGHSQVDEIGPDGRVVTTMFSQSDRLKGRPQEVQVKAGAQLLTKQQYTYDWEEQPGGVFPRNEHEAATGLGIYWIYTIREINKIYDSTGWSGRKAEYTYGSYGNLTETVESAWNGSAWANYRKNTVDYYPNDDEGVYLVSLPAAKRSFNSAGVLQAASYYFYDSHHSDYHTIPSMGKLTAVRTRVEVNKYSQVTYGYDGTWGNRIAVTSYSGYSDSVDTTPSGARTTSTDYDAVYHTYPLSETNPLSQTTAWVYDYSLGVPLSETDPNGAVTSASYDKFGRLIKVIRPGDTSNSPTIKIDYYDQANPFRVDIQQKITGSTYFTLRRYYDGMGRQFLVEQGSSSPGFTLASTVEYTYDAYGKVTSQSMPYASGETKYHKDSTYDVLGRPLIITMPHIGDEGNSLESSYSYDGLITTITDANGHETISTNDTWGRTISVNPPAGPTVTYAYDTLDHMVSAVRSGLTTEIDYDSAGRKISMDDPDMGEWSYIYNGVGSLTWQTDARGCTTNLVYDILNRLTTKSYSGAACNSTSSVNYTYTQGDYDNPGGAINRSTEMSDGSGSTYWEFDARGRVTLEGKTISGQTFNTQWAYNSADLPASMTYPGSEQVTYTYNGQMMLEGMEGTNIYIQSTTYDSAGRMTERLLGNGMTKAYSYYAWSQQGGRLQNLTTGSMQNMSYTYDYAGNVTTITDALAGPQTQEFIYNAADMVTHASAAGGTYGLYSENYSYSSGNLYNKGGVTNTYGDPAHPHAVTARSNGNTYVYDDNGNQTRREIGNDTYDLKYDAENRLVEVKKNSTVIATFTYDGDGKQVKGTVNGVTTYYVGAYYQKQGTQVTKYYYAGVERVAMRQGGVLYYIFGDHLGSTAVVKNTQGGKTELRYTAWGTTRYEYGSTPTDRRYTGQREEADLGLYFYNARWYDPALGRFIQADSIVPGAGNPQAWDRYAYVNNDPVRYTDPSGHKECADVDEYGRCLVDPPLAPAIPPSPVGGDTSTPWDVGIQWLTGLGTRHHEYREGDPFSELLQKHEYLEEVRGTIARRIIGGNYRPYKIKYDLGGLEGIPKYVRDYSTLLTFGQTGNLAVTYLGSYDLNYFVVSVDRSNGTAEVLFNVENESNLASITHLPFFGYLEFWRDKIEPVMNNLVHNGPMSEVTQSFWWTEYIHFK